MPSLKRFSTSPVDGFNSYSARFCNSSSFSFTLLANSSSVSQKEQYPLTDEDKSVLEGLQKYQPDAGWTAEKFYKSKVKK